MTNALAKFSQDKHAPPGRVGSDADLILLQDGAWSDASGKIESVRAPAFLQVLNGRLAAKQRVTMRTEGPIPLAACLT